MNKRRKAVIAILSLDERDRSLPSQLLFFVAFAIWLFGRVILGQTTFASLMGSYFSIKMMRIICFSMLFIRELLFGSWNRRTFYGFVCAAFIAFMAYEGALEVVFDSAILVFFGRNVPFRNIAQFCFVFIVLTVAITSLCAVAGAIPNRIIEDGVRGARLGLGFGHPNTAPAFVFFALCLWVFLREKKYGFLELAISVAVACALYQLTGNRTSCLLVAVLAVFAFVSRWLPTCVLRHRVFGAICVSWVAICAIAAVLLAISFDPSIPWMKSLDSLLSGRLNLGHRVISEYGISFIGQSVNMSDVQSYSLATGIVSDNKNSGIVIDCAYIKLLIRCGLPALVVLVLLSTSVCFTAFREGQWWLLLVMFFIGLHGISESCCIYATYNAFIFLLGTQFYERIS